MGGTRAAARLSRHLRRACLGVALVAVSTACGSSGRPVAAREQAAPSATTAPTTGNTDGAVPGTATVGAGSIASATVVPQTSRTTSTPTLAPTTAGTMPPTSRAPVPPAAGGAYGVITAGPTCPVERAGHPCPPNPVTAQLDARGAGGAAVASTHSDSAGRYSLGLPPGRYSLVVAGGSMFPRCPVTDITVATGSSIRADIGCDTGIR